MRIGVALKYNYRLFRKKHFSLNAVASIQFQDDFGGELFKKHNFFPI